MEGGDFLEGCPHKPAPSAGDKGKLRQRVQCPVCSPGGKGGVTARGPPEQGGERGGVHNPPPPQPALQMISMVMVAVGVYARLLKHAGEVGG